MYKIHHKDTSLNNKIFSLFNSKEYVFVETGSNTGKAIELALKHFKEVHSIECQENFYEYCRKKFKNNDRVFLYHSKSEDIIDDLCKKIKLPCFFWLDAHLRNDAPLNEEISAILSRKNNLDIIAIDDIHLIKNKSYWGAKFTIPQITKRLDGYAIRYFDGKNVKKKIMVAINESV